MHSKAELIDAINSGAHFKYVFFWGHTSKAPGVLDKSCLSQWYPAPFNVDGVFYPTAEHWMMAEKARLFGDEQILDKILASAHPGEAKKLGRQVRGFVRKTWEKSREDIVTAGNLARFSQNPDLGDFLKATHNRVLVEASPQDLIWGIGLAEDSDDAPLPRRWPGENLLGFCLMRVREAIQAPSP
jgi:ribA/ribD-fused uncharacterized protein